MNEFFINPHAKFQTLVDLLRWRSLHQPSQNAYTFLTDGELEEVGLTYADLDRRAQTIGTSLQNLDAIGKPVLLIYPPGLEYIAAFFGCLYAGCIAVPAYPPRSSRSDVRLQAIVDDTQSTIALTTERILSHVIRQIPYTPNLAHLNWVTTDNLPTNLMQELYIPKLTNNTLAILQYTSGSTTIPRGVMLTHGNLLHNLSLIYQRFEDTQNSQAVSWLPPYHDMGLIGGILQPLYGGFPVVLMSPAAFLQRPVRWLQAISRYKATASGGPNFAYDLCVRKVTADQLQELDLSHWTLAFNGAEPVRKETLERFAVTFERFGFRMEAFYPCYGLAEAALFVSGGSRRREPIVRVFEQASMGRNQVVEASKDDIATQNFVSCGQTLSNQKILIVHPESLNKCSPDQVGEIWVSGPSIAQGYWNRSKETEQTFHAYLKDTGDGPFLRTGDLGFLRNDELFITGRLKDLITIRGRNHYPQDIELTVERSDLRLRRSFCASFSTEIDGEERLVVVQEIERHVPSADVDEVIGKIRQSVAEHHGLQIYTAVLIRTGSIPKTSSGKIQRHACRAAFLMKSLDVVREDTIKYTADLEKNFQSPEELTARITFDMNRVQLESYLQSQIARMLGIPTKEIDARQSLTQLGMDSLVAAELKNQIEIDFNVDIPIVNFLQNGGVAQIATQILDQQLEIVSTDLTSLASTQELQFTLQKDVARDKCLPLSFEQEWVWALDRLMPGNAAYNIPMAIRLLGSLDVNALWRSLNEVVLRHEALRTTIAILDGRPVQIIAPTFSVKLPVIDIRKLPEVERETKALHLANEEASCPFNLAHGPLLRTIVIQLTEQNHIVVFTMHHLISDISSMAILIREVAECYKAFSIGMLPQLPMLAFQYGDFVMWQRQYLQGETLERLLSYWKKKISLATSIVDRLIDRPRPTVRSFQGGHNFFKLSPILSQSLKELSRKEGATLFMTLLAAFKTLLFLCTSQETIPVGFPISGRTHSGAENLIGFFAHPLLLCTNMSDDPSFHDVLSRVQEIALEAYDHQNIPFTKIVEVGQSERNTSYSPLCQIMFTLVKNPLDLVDLPSPTFRLINIESGMIDFDLFLTMMEDKEGLHGSLGYNTDVFDPETVKYLINSYCDVLEKCVRTPETKLSDFKLNKRLKIDDGSSQSYERKPMIVIAATFTAEPVMDSLNFWMQELGIPFCIKIDKYSQIFQQLLDSSSLFSKNQDGVNVVLVRFEDWQKFTDAENSTEIAMNFINHDEIERNVRDLVVALKFATKRSAIPYLVCLCPTSPPEIIDTNYIKFLKEMEDLTISELNDVNNLYLITPWQLGNLYPVSTYYDSFSNKLGHIPYTSLFFTSLGTMIARRIHAMQRPPYKVIVLDCDQVLWKGVIGEDGLQGIELDPNRNALQNFMITQHTLGMFICICSKNNEEDVIEVFERYPEMPLKRDHIATWRINWLPKSENIKSLAEELQLDLDSFIFIDDDAIELAEVQANCPEVLALQLPQKSDGISEFFNHVWAFDHLKNTEEDSKRNKRHMEEYERRHYQRDSQTFSDFLMGLCLNVKFSTLSLQYLARASQLTQRTNQFNFTTIRRSEGELQTFYQLGAEECLTVEVDDRFGDYGMVGLIIFKVELNSINVDTFLLSCRALGRGVEHKMLAKLGEIAQGRGLSFLNLSYIPTKKNQPALNFLESVGGQFKRQLENGWLFQLPVKFASSVSIH